MDAEIHWEDEAKSAIRYTWSWDWNWDDFYRILERRDLDLGTDRNAHVIVDFRQTGNPPSDAILHLKRAAKMADETDKLIILITRSTTIVTLYNAFIAMYSSIGKRLRIVNTEQEAYALLGLSEQHKES